jgi:hypothetical protein
MILTHLLMDCLFPTFNLTKRGKHEREQKKSVLRWKRSSGKISGVEFLWVHEPPRKMVCVSRFWMTMAGGLTAMTSGACVGDVDSPGYLKSRAD